MEALYLFAAIIGITYFIEVCMPKIDSYLETMIERGIAARQGAK